MAFDVPRWWWTGFVVGLLLLALGGALNAVEEGMRDNYSTDGCGHTGGGARPADEQPDDVDCRGQRLTIGWVDAFSQATFGPGIAITILTGVYLIGAAIALTKGGGKQDDGKSHHDEDQGGPKGGGAA